MDKESVARLRFDRRLRRRPGWIEETDHAAHLASLPDVSEKLTTCAEEEDAGDSLDATSEAAPVSPTVAPPVPTAGDFSSPSPLGRFGGESD